MVGYRLEKSTKKGRVEISFITNMVGYRLQEVRNASSGFKVLLPTWLVIDLEIAEAANILVVLLPTWLVIDVFHI